MRTRAIVGALALLSTAGVAAVAHAHGSASSTRAVIYGAGFKPQRFYPDNRTVASGFRWSVWSSTVAIGTGLTKTCAPGGVHCTTTRQSLVYTEPQRACGQLTFTRFSYSKWPTRGQLSAVGTVCLWYTS